jgi:hypothetical protein
MADPGGEPASRRAGTVDGRLQAPDRRQARELVRSEAGERASPRDGGSALSRSANAAAGGPPAARRPRRTGTPVGTPVGALAAYAAVCAAVIATVMASRDVTA